MWEASNVVVVRIPEGQTPGGPLSRMPLVPTALSSFRRDGMDPAASTTPATVAFAVAYPGVISAS
jgi:hypothetical protein